MNGIATTINSQKDQGTDLQDVEPKNLLKCFFEIFLLKSVSIYNHFCLHFFYKRIKTKQLAVLSGKNDKILFE